jgi:hypothetical protein
MSALSVSDLKAMARESVAEMQVKKARIDQMVAAPARSSTTPSVSELKRMARESVAELKARRTQLARTYGAVERRPGRSVRYRSASERTRKMVRRILALAAATGGKREGRTVSMTVGGTDFKFRREDGKWKELAQ